jgi:hypothetical protein
MSGARGVVALLGIGVALAGFCPGAAWAGGPLSADRTGRPFVWDATKPIHYTMDAGNLGRFSNAQVAQWVADAFKQWSSVEGAAFSVEATAPFTEDITGENILDVLDALPVTTNLIILDSDGSVLDELYGLGDDASGVGGPDAWDTRTGKITQGSVILNGRDSQSYSTDWVRGSLIEHEIGHFLGLTHSQLNNFVTYDGDTKNDHLAPRMSYNDGPNSVPGLHAEDKAWIAALYPKNGAVATTGRIRGEILMPDGKTGLQGIQVVARRDGDEAVTAVSGISGWQFRSVFRGVAFGSPDVALRGVYELPQLPPGNYRLSVEPLAFSPSIDPAHASLPGGARLWREGSPASTQRGDATLIPVAAGQVVEGRSFIVGAGSVEPTEVDESEPNEVMEFTSTVASTAIVKGRVSQRDSKYWSIGLGGGRRDGIEDWVRVVITEPSLVSATLTAGNAAADLNLFLWEGPFFDTTPREYDRSAAAGTETETIQAELDPGVYFIGVSAADVTSNPESEYRLQLVTAPLGEDEEVTPKITFAMVSHMTTSSLRVRWQTDREASAVIYAGTPMREFGDAAQSRDHVLDVTGVPSGREQIVTLFSQTTSEALATEDLTITTPRPGSGPDPNLVSGLWGVLPEDDAGREFSLIVRLINYGDGPATRTELQQLALPRGWEFAAPPPPLPLDMGTIGVEAATLIFARVTRVADDAAPLGIVVRGVYSDPAGTSWGFRTR